MAKKFNIKDTIVRIESNNLSSLTNDDLTIFERTGTATLGIGLIDFTLFKFHKYANNSTTVSLKPLAIMYATYSGNSNKITSITFSKDEEGDGISVRYPTSEQSSRTVVLIVDRTPSGNTTSWKIPFGSMFKPANSDNADYLCVPKKVNIFYIREYLPGAFIVNGQSI